MLRESTAAQKALEDAVEAQSDCQPRSMSEHKKAYIGTGIMSLLDTPLALSSAQDLANPNGPFTPFR